MSYSVVLTDIAIQDLHEIASWIAEESKDIETAKSFVNELKEKCSRLESFPNSGALPKDHILISMGYRFIVHGNYLIFYLTDEEQKTVNIMAIFNAKKDYARVLSRMI